MAILLVQSASPTVEVHNIALRHKLPIVSDLKFNMHVFRRNIDLNCGWAATAASASQTRVSDGWGAPAGARALAIASSMHKTNPPMTNRRRKSKWSVCCRNS